MILRNGSPTSQHLLTKTTATETNNLPLPTDQFRQMLSVMENHSFVPGQMAYFILNRFCRSHLSSLGFHDKINVLSNTSIVGQWLPSFTVKSVFECAM